MSTRKWVIEITVCHRLVAEWLDEHYSFQAPPKDLTIHGISFGDPELNWSSSKVAAATPVAAIELGIREFVDTIADGRKLLGAHGRVHFTAHPEKDGRR